MGKPLHNRRSREALSLVAVGLAGEVLLLIAVLGPFSLLDHGTRLVDLGYLTHGQPEAARAVTVGLLALFLFYGFALIFASGLATTTGTAVTLLGTAIFSLTLSFLYPATANDAYTYVVQGYIAVFHGLNPLVDPPASVARDPFVYYAGQWMNSASPYGPLWLDVSRLAVRVSGRNVVAGVLFLKLFNAATVVGSSALLARLVPGRRALAVVFFGWNPLVQLELVGNGHNDALMIFLLLAAVTFSRGRHRAMGAVALTGSILTKYLTIGALPFFLLACLTSPPVSQGGRGSGMRILRPRRLTQAFPVVLAALGTAAVLFAPYWVGPTTLQRVLGVNQNYLASPSALIILLDAASPHWLGIARLAILAGVYLWLGFRQLRGTIGEADATFEGLFALILCAPHFAGWYLAVLVALAPVDGSGWRMTRAAIFSLAATLTVPLWAFVWPAQSATLTLLTFHEIIVPLTFGPPLIVAAMAAAVAIRRRTRRESDGAKEEDVEVVRESA